MEKSRIVPRASTWSVVRRTSFGLKYSARILSASSHSGAPLATAAEDVWEHCVHSSWGRPEQGWQIWSCHFWAGLRWEGHPVQENPSPALPLLDPSPPLAQVHTWHLRKVYSKSFSKNVHLVFWVTALILLLVFIIVFWSIFRTNRKMKI